MTVKVSAIIPCYNDADDVGDALESVLSQTACDKIAEIIVVDDGSKDHSAQVLQSYVRKHEKVKYLYQENQGPGAARNRGIRESKQPYIAFLDADDVWLPSRIEQQLTFARNHPTVALVCADCYVETESGSRYRTYCRDFSYERGDNMGRLFTKGGPILMPSVLVRRKCIMEAGLFDESLPIGQDSDMWLRIAARSPIHHLNVPVATVRKRAGSVASDVEAKAKYLKQITEKLIIMYPRLAPLRGSRQAKIETYLGFHMLRQGRKREAFIAALHAIQHDVHNLKGWLLLPAAMAPSLSLEIWRWIKRRPYGHEQLLEEDAS